MIPLLLIPLTAILSALQGNNALGKGWLIAFHVVSFTLLGFLAGLPWLYAIAAAVVVPALFWFVLRGGAQAEEELDYMDGRPWAKLSRVAIVHAPHLVITIAFLLYPACTGSWVARIGIVASLLAYPLPTLALTRWNYKKSPHLVNTGKFWDVRRPVEIATGISGGVQGAALLAAAISMWGV